MQQKGGAVANSQQEESSYNTVSTMKKITLIFSKLIVKEQSHKLKAQRQTLVGYSYKFCATVVLVYFAGRTD